MFLIVRIVCKNMKYKSIRLFNGYFNSILRLKLTIEHLYDFMKFVVQKDLIWLYQNEKHFYKIDIKQLSIIFQTEV